MFEKGKSGNPNGRPKKGSAWADIYNEILDSSIITMTLEIDGQIIQRSLKVQDNKTMRYALGVKLLEEGLTGNVQAIKEMSDRTEGKPRDKVQISDDDNNKTFTVVFND